MYAASSVGKGVFHFPGEIDADGLLLVTVTQQTVVTLCSSWGLQLSEAPDH